MESEKIRVVPADFEDKLLHHLQEKFIDDTNKEECQETIECLMEYIGSMFITMDYEGKKNAVGQVSAFTMLPNSKILAPVVLFVRAICLRFSRIAL